MHLACTLSIEVVNSLRVVNLLHVVSLVRQGPLGRVLGLKDMMRITAAQIMDDDEDRAGRNL